ncbi:PTS N-acetylgalactosamine transporter subunit IID, partial [Morganella morganii]
MASEKNHSSAAEAETLLPADCNQNVYEDQSTGAELTRKDINRVAWRSLLLQA